MHRWLWFIGLYLAGLITLSVIAFAIRSAIFAG